MRHRTTPHGRSPVRTNRNLAYFTFLSDDPATRTEAFGRSQVTCIEDAVFPVVELDGKAVHDPGRYFERSVLFDVHMREDSLFWATADDIPELTLSRTR